MNRDLIFNFKKTIKYNEIINDISKLSGIIDEDKGENSEDYLEALNDIAQQIQRDYDREFLNYKAYINDCRNIRMLYEFRKIYSINWLGFEDVYSVIEKCITADEIREVRKQLLSIIFKGFYDMDWQLYRVIQVTNKNRNLEGYALNWESCFKDYKEELDYSPEETQWFDDMDWFYWRRTVEERKELERKEGEFEQLQFKLKEEALKNEHTKQIMIEAEQLTPNWKQRDEVVKQLRAYNRQLGKIVWHKNHKSHFRKKEDIDKLWYYAT